MNTETDMISIDLNTLRFPPTPANNVVQIGDMWTTGGNLHIILRNERGAAEQYPVITIFAHGDSLYAILNRVDPLEPEVQAPPAVVLFNGLESIRTLSIKELDGLKEPALDALSNPGSIQAIGELAALIPDIDEKSAQARIRHQLTSEILIDSVMVEPGTEMELSHLANMLNTVHTHLNVVGESQQGDFTFIAAPGISGQQYIVVMYRAATMAEETNPPLIPLKVLGGRKVTPISYTDMLGNRRALVKAISETDELALAKRLDELLGPIPRNKQVG